MKLKYNEYLKPEIVSASIIQSKDTVWLESVKVEKVEGGLEKQTVSRIDLGFIADDEDNESQGLYFNPEDSIEENVRKFINEFTTYDIINTTDLFNDEASDKIDIKYNTFGIDRK